MPRLTLGSVFLFLVAVHPAWSQAGTQLACAMPPALVLPAASLSNAATALTARSELDILALGSGSTIGDTGASAGPALSYRTPNHAFPNRMLATLTALHPAVRFNLTVRGGRGLTADEMLPILQRELATHHYDLVLWQIGTVEAVHGVPPASLRAVLEGGIEAAVRSQTDVILIDPQFSRFLQTNADLGPYQTVLRQMTDTSGVTLFPRFDLTQEWAKNGQVDLERVDKDQRANTIALLNDCLGHALARYVLAGAGER